MRDVSGANVAARGDGRIKFVTNIETSFCILAEGFLMQTDGSNAHPVPVSPWSSSSLWSGTRHQGSWPLRDF